MANRRTLKKQIRAILGQLMDECIICNLVLPKFDNTTLDSFAARIIEINDEFIARANHPEGTKDPKRTKQYYSRAYPRHEQSERIKKKVVLIVRLLSHNNIIYT